MNIEDLWYSIYFKTTERSDSIICHLSLFISHSLKFHKRQNSNGCAVG
ncbi:hypothetical protein D1AOALGA4SA_9681 [Olavius algarvensis Delta 1 endosymbiont]|nr:hypothetical protein D1AOALGA4SA_9681 [Olavius algarvensis Delta 1 endosymbiont]